MASLTIEQNIRSAGHTIRKNLTRTSSGGGQFISTTEDDGSIIPAGFAGELTTRTGDGEGTVTMDDVGHGIESSDNVDVYWSSGIRYDMTVGTVSGATVPLADSGAGDALPVQDTAVIVSKRVEVARTIVGPALKAIAIDVFRPQADSDTARVHVQFLDDSSVEVTALAIVPRDALVADVVAGHDNPFGSDTVTEWAVSNGSTAAPAWIKALWVEDATP